MTTTAVTAQPGATGTAFAAGLPMVTAARATSGRLHPVVAVTTITAWIAVRSARVTPVLDAPVRFAVCLKGEARPITHTGEAEVAALLSLKTTKFPMI